MNLDHEGTKLHEAEPDTMTFVILRVLSGLWFFLKLDQHYSVKTTDCTPEISKRLRQRRFLQAIMSSLRSM